MNFKNFYKMKSPEKGSFFMSVSRAGEACAFTLDMADFCPQIAHNRKRGQESAARHLCPLVCIESLFCTTTKIGCDERRKTETYIY